MYVVIPVAVEETNATLPLAIASIRAHTDYNIVTIGHNHGLCEHIDTVQGANIWANTDLAMRTACERFPAFIWSADDTYWTRPAEPVRWALGQLGQTARRGLYGRRKDATRAWLEARDLPTWDYESHTPMPIQAAPMLEALDAITVAPMLDKRTIYGNMTGLPDVIAADVKMRERDTELPDTAWIASHDYGPRELVYAHVRERMNHARLTPMP